MFGSKKKLLEGFNKELQAELIKTSTDLDNLLGSLAVFAYEGDVTGRTVVGLNAVRRLLDDYGYYAESVQV